MYVHKHFINIVQIVGAYHKLNNYKGHWIF